MLLHFASTAAIRTALAAPRARAGFLAAQRFLSSKKSDNLSDPLTPPQAKNTHSQSTENAAQEAPDSLGLQIVTSQKLAKQKYMSFDDLPKPPEEFQNMSTEEFHAQLNMTPVPIKRATRLDSDGYKFAFNLPAENLLPRRDDRLTRGALGSIEPNLALLGIGMNHDTMQSGLEEHPSRESITGVCVLNPLLHEVKNKTLWELFPSKTDFDSSQFGDPMRLDAFKEWEASMNKSLDEAKKDQRIKEKKFQDFYESFQESNSFMRKPAQVRRAAAAPSPAKTDKQVTNGRRKLDRKLLRQYRKYRNEENGKK